MSAVKVDGGNTNHLSGTVQQGPGFRSVGITCDGCARFFPGYVHVEGHVEAPAWEQHARLMQHTMPSHEGMMSALVEAGWTINPDDRRGIESAYVRLVNEGGVS